MTKAEIKTKMIQLILVLFKDMNLDKDFVEYIDLIEDIGMDSIFFISLIIEIEEAFGITVPDDKLLMENFRKIDDIVDIVGYELSIY